MSEKLTTCAQLVAELIAIRKTAGMSQYDLAKKAGRSPGLLSLIERTGTAKLETIEDFAKALGLNVIVYLEPIPENPALVLMDIIKASDLAEQIDTEAIIEWADYCNEKPAP